MLRGNPEIKSLGFFDLGDFGHVAFSHILRIDHGFMAQGPRTCVQMFG
jgi:hypothetical protein